MPHQGKHSNSSPPTHANDPLILPPEVHNNNEKNKASVIAAYFSHLNKTAAIAGGFSYDASTYGNDLFCTSPNNSTNNLACKENINDISNYMGVSIGLSVALLSLGSTLYFIGTKKEKSRNLKKAIKIFEGIVGFSAGHINYRRLFSLGIAQLLSKLYPDRPPREEIQWGDPEFIPILISAGVLAAFTLPALRYRIRKIYLKRMQGIESKDVSRGNLAKATDVLGGMISGYVDLYGLLGAGEAVVKNLFPFLPSLPSYGRYGILPVLSSIEAGIVNFKLSPQNYVNLPKLTRAQSYYLDTSNSIRQIIGTTFFMLLLYSLIFIVEFNDKDRTHFNPLSSMFYALIGAALGDILLKFWHNRLKHCNERPEENIDKANLEGILINENEEKIEEVTEKTPLIQETTLVSSEPKKGDGTALTRCRDALFSCFCVPSIKETKGNGINSINSLGGVNLIPR